jgi:hypothetical protein
MCIMVSAKKKLVLRFAGELFYGAMRGYMQARFSSPLSKHGERMGPIVMPERGVRIEYLGEYSTAAPQDGTASFRPPFLPITGLNWTPGKE